MNGSINPENLPRADKGRRCDVCGRMHPTEADRIRGRQAGNVTSVNVLEAEIAYAHHLHEQKVKNTPPEYVI